MSELADPVPTHPVLTCAARLDRALDEVAGVSPTYMSVDEKRQALLDLHRVEARLAALRMRVAAVADDVAEAEGARDVAALLAHHLRSDRLVERRELRLAEALDRRWTHAADALCRGRLNVPQALAITRALDALPLDEVDAPTLAAAEERLVAEAAHHGPHDLAVLGRKILEVVAPATFESQEGRQLVAEEQRAARRMSLTSTKAGDGSTRLVIVVPDAVATRLHTYLEAFTSPRHSGVTGEADRLPVHQQRAAAFAAFLEAVDPRRLPVHGGDATTLIVTVSLEDLRRDLGVAEIPGVGRLTAAEARRLACTAHLVPAVLGTDSEVLDLGRASRLFKPPQRRAMVLRDGRCRAEACTVPAAWCEAHHWRRPWSQGGLTDLDDGVLLCPFHHHRAHDVRFDARRMTSGDVRFSRRT